MRKYQRGVAREIASSARGQAWALSCTPAAWVMARQAQGRGYAREAARSLVARLHESRWLVAAHIHPRHLASQPVARAAGLSPSSESRDGEIRWTSRPEIPH